MMNRHLERKIQITKVEMLREDLRYPMQLEYYMTESEIEEQDELSGLKAYGIEIVKILGDRETERQLIKNFCCDETTAKETISKLANNIVTPSGLYFVLEDLVGE